MPKKNMIYKGYTYFEIQNLEIIKKNIKLLKKIIQSDILKVINNIQFNRIQKELINLILPNILILQNKNIFNIINQITKILNIMNMLYIKKMDKKKMEYQISISTKDMNF